MWGWWRWNEDKDKEAEIKQEIPEATPIPKPTTRSAVMEITLVNNKTDKEYVIKSVNDFGIAWTYTGGENEKYRLLIIKQKLSVEGDLWNAAGHFVDFSMSKIVHQTFNI